MVKTSKSQCLAEYLFKRFEDVRLIISLPNPGTKSRPSAMGCHVIVTICTCGKS